MQNPLECPIFPALEPFDSGWLEVESPHAVYYEQCGNPQGVPVVVLHGGPGSGCTPAQRRFFDPAHYRIVLFDQRGCGRSEPAGCLELNTTAALVTDIERLRRHLGIKRWLVFGGSWGSTLALAYAAAHAGSIGGLLLRGIFLARNVELEWFLLQARNIYPEAWTQFTSLLAPEETNDPMPAYAERIFGPDQERSLEAARNWNAYEASIMTLLPQQPATGSPPADSAIVARARIQLHYLMNGCFLGDMPLLEQVPKFRHLPALIVQGRYDIVCPVISAWELHQAWPEAELRIVADAGHAAFEPGTAAALIGATEQFKSIEL